jgi:hypothetical protein
VELYVPEDGTPTFRFDICYDLHKPLPLFRLQPLALWSAGNGVEKREVHIELPVIWAYVNRRLEDAQIDNFADPGPQNFGVVEDGR